MSQNFFLDNPDLQLRLENLDLREVLELKEKGYAESDVYPTAPRNYADAKDNYRIVLDVLGEICGERVAPRAAEADEEGAHYEDGEVTYAAATLDAIDALKQAELFGAMLPREFGGLNLPESVYSMMVEIVARAESGLMTVYGLQEIASCLEEYGDPETKARVLPKFSRGEVSGAMVLTEADAGSDLGADFGYGRSPAEGQAGRLEGRIGQVDRRSARSLQRQLGQGLLPDRPAPNGARQADLRASLFASGSHHEDRQVRTERVGSGHR